MNQRANISTLTAYHSKAHLGQVNISNLKFCNSYHTQAQLHVLAAAGFLVKAFTVDFYGRVRWWVLTNLTNELCACSFYLLLSISSDIDLLVGFGLHIIRGRGCAEYHGACVFFLLCLEGIDLLGHFTGADDEQAGSQRVE